MTMTLPCLYIKEGIRYRAQLTLSPLHGPYEGLLPHYAYPQGIKVPPPPDYSTPAAVTARCRERGSESTTSKTWTPVTSGSAVDYIHSHHAFMQAFHAAGHDTKWAAAYRGVVTANLLVLERALKGDIHVANKVRPTLEEGLGA